MEFKINFNQTFVFLSFKMEKELSFFCTIKKFNVKNKVEAGRSFK